MPTIKALPITKPKNMNAAATHSVNSELTIRYLSTEAKNRNGLLRCTVLVRHNTTPKRKALTLRKGPAMWRNRVDILLFFKPGRHTDKSWTIDGHVAKAQRRQFRGHGISPITLTALTKHNNWRLR
jgi:hypothetical protein